MNRPPIDPRAIDAADAVASPIESPMTLGLSLVAHTNVGKTTLARTLLGRDIGEVRDAPHVTEFADVHTMLKTPEGDVLELWDTPGFGDSVRLMRRLRQSTNPIGWFMSEVWDRWRDRPFWGAQQAVKNVREKADVLLYLVSAAEAPEAAGYVAPEMELLAWTGKPLVILLNQLGAPAAPTLASDVERWSSHLAALAPAASVLSFDAFARCWVQEIALLEAVQEKLVDRERKAAMGRLVDAWRRERLATFEASMATLAESLARIASAHEIIAANEGIGARLRGFVSALGLGRGPRDDVTAAAHGRLQERLLTTLRESASALIRLHHLEGQSEVAGIEAVQTDVHEHVEPGWAAILGGAVSGGLAGLSVDLLAGGMTLGGGLISGGVLGAAAAAGLAHGVNRVRGTDHSWLAWNAEALMPMVDAALLRYLAVAHFGRGRGSWADGTAPAGWAVAVAEALAPHRHDLAALWDQRVPSNDGDPLTLMRNTLEVTLRSAARGLLERLYPEAVRAFGS